MQAENGPGAMGGQDRMHAGGGEPEILFEERGEAGLVTFNRPRALNALTPGMVRDMAARLRDWAEAPGITRIVVRGEGGRAFCAGGDIRLLRDALTGGRQEEARVFWREEYALDMATKTSPKPYVALIDGIVMGGGVGVSLHGRFRVASESYVFAMPEVGIGFFPDVGATHVLSRLPGRMGAWLALTGERIGPARALALGLATHFVPAADHAALADALAAPGDTAAVLDRFSREPPPAQEDVDEAVIAQAFAGESVGAILAALDSAAETGSAFAARTAALMRTKSPLSLAIAHEQLRRAAGLTFEEAMAMDGRIAARMPENPDFAEGIRAVLIDRDNAPRWSHTGIDSVSREEVERFFAPLPRDGMAAQP